MISHPTASSPVQDGRRIAPVLVVASHVLHFVAELALGVCEFLSSPQSCPVRVGSSGMRERKFAGSPATLHFANRGSRPGVRSAWSSVAR